MAQVSDRLFATGNLNLYLSYLLLYWEILDLEIWACLEAIFAPGWYAQKFVFHTNNLFRDLFGASYNPLGDLMETSWKFLEAFWVAEMIFQRFCCDCYSENEVQFDQKTKQCMNKDMKTIIIKIMYFRQWFLKELGFILRRRLRTFKIIFACN